MADKKSSGAGPAGKGKAEAGRVEKTLADSSSGKKPPVRKPAVKKPAGGTTMGKNPAAKRSVAKKTLIEKTAVKKSAATKVAAMKPAAKKPVGKLAAAKKPAAKKSTAKIPEGNKAAVKKTAANQTQRGAVSDRKTPEKKPLKASLKPPAKTPVKAPVKAPAKMPSKVPAHKPVSGPIGLSVPSLTVPGSVDPSSIPAAVLDLMDTLDNDTLGGRRWMAAVGTIVGKLDAKAYPDFLDSLEWDSLSGKTVLKALGSAKAGGTAKLPAKEAFSKCLKDGSCDAASMRELLECLRNCLCCCRCWPCRPWRFCKICCHHRIQVGQGNGSFSWANKLDFLGPTVSVDAARKATVNYAAVPGGVFAPIAHESSPSAHAGALAPYAHLSDPAAHPNVFAPKAYDKNKCAGYASVKSIDLPNFKATIDNSPESGSPAPIVVSLDGHGHSYAPISGSANYAAAGHSHATFQWAVSETDSQDAPNASVTVESGGWIKYKVARKTDSGNGPFKVLSDSYAQRTDRADFKTMHVEAFATLFEFDGPDEWLFVRLKLIRSDGVMFSRGLSTWDASVASGYSLKLMLSISGLG